jgi:hypothetical protein
VKRGTDPHILWSSPFRLGPTKTAEARQGELTMRIAVALAFVVVAVAPLIGIGWGHVWAKANRMTLRATPPSAEQSNQAA